MHFRGEDARRLQELRSAATARLRPDLVVADVHAPPQTLSTRAIDVVADISERNSDTGAQATVTLMLGPTPVAASKTVTVPADGSFSVTFEGVKLTTVTSAELKVVIDDSEPFETDATNNAGTTTVEVTEHELVRSNILVQSLGGYGAQFNNHVYAPITPWPAGHACDDFEAKAKALQPHIVRIFYNDNWDGNRNGAFPDWEKNYASFVKVVRLAQEAGATINISFQNLGERQVDAGAGHDEVRRRARGPGSQSRPHECALGRGRERAELRRDGRGVARGVQRARSGRWTSSSRPAVSAITSASWAPGLVENAGVPSRTHYVWMQWIAANMGDVLDAWGQHVYWFYNDTGRLEYRLRDIWHLLNEVIPPEQRKPTYMMEYGIRGISTCAGKPTIANTYYAADPSCPEIWRTKIGGFQQFWFAVASAQLGYVGAAKWDAYWGVYDRTLVPPQVYWTIAPPTEGSFLTPSYHSLALLFHTTVPGWQVIRVAPWDESDWGVPTYGIEGHSSNDTPEKELAAYTGPTVS